MTEALSLYYRLPYPLKVLVASARGYQLRRERYSALTEHLVSQTLERDTWSRARWQNWREQQLVALLRRAATRVPYYRNYWDTQRRLGRSSQLEVLDHWPILEKSVVRQNPNAFIADDRDIEKLHSTQTGGTTGQPTRVYQTRDTSIRWYAMFEARARRWHRVSHDERWVMFGGRRIVDLGRTRPPFWVHNYGLRQLYCSIFHITAQSTPAYVTVLREFSPTHMIVFPSAVSILAHHMIAQRLSPPQTLRVIFSNSERVLPDQRTMIEDAFGCPLVDTYGMAEMAAASTACEHGTQHFWPDAGVTEIYDRDRGVVHNHGTGEFALTGLVNDDMPLIRYLNGDVGSVPNWESSCRCGRTLPELGTLDGRSNDLITTADGRKLYLLDSLFNGLPVVEAQLVQETLSRYTVRLVPASGFDAPAVRDSITKTLGTYVGEAIDVELEIVSSIAKSANGKFVPYVSRITPR